VQQFDGNARWAQLAGVRLKLQPAAWLHDPNDRDVIDRPWDDGLLTRQFLPDDPPSRAQLKALSRHVRATLREVADRLRWEGAAARAIGTSKTFKQLARLAGAPAQRKGPFVRRYLTGGDLDTWTPRLAGLKASQRAKLRGVSHPRARQIVTGALVAKAAMRTLDVPTLEVSPWALREGIVLHYLHTKLDQSLKLPLYPRHQTAEDGAQIRALASARAVRTQAED
jgi:exopolyphosphatase / guanosine-5'-triphosphate,3'-diphosphate pyrophosphatase